MAAVVLVAFGLVRAVGAVQGDSGPVLGLRSGSPRLRFDSHDWEQGVVVSFADPKKALDDVITDWVNVGGQDLEASSENEQHNDLVQQRDPPAIDPPTDTDAVDESELRSEFWTTNGKVPVPVGNAVLSSFFGLSIIPSREVEERQQSGESGCTDEEKKEGNRAETPTCGDGFLGQPDRIIAVEYFKNGHVKAAWLRRDLKLFQAQLDIYEEQKKKKPDIKKPEEPATLPDVFRYGPVVYQILPIEEQKPPSSTEHWWYEPWLYKGEGGVWREEQKVKAPENLMEKLKAASEAGKLQVEVGTPLEGEEGAWRFENWRRSSPHLLVHTTRKHELMQARKTFEI